MILYDLFICWLKQIQYRQIKCNWYSNENIAMFILIANLEQVFPVRYNDDTKGDDFY